MTSLQDFFAMGGYAFYVWSALGLSALILGAILLWSAHELKRVRRESFAIALREQDRKLKRDSARKQSSGVTQ